LIIDDLNIVLSVNTESKKIAKSYYRRFLFKELENLFANLVANNLLFDKLKFEDFMFREANYDLKKEEWPFDQKGKTNFREMKFKISKSQKSNSLTCVEVIVGNISSPIVCIAECNEFIRILDYDDKLTVYFPINSEVLMKTKLVSSFGIKKRIEYVCF
jgi:hypothetical protein